jgi:predicted transcriptional regulator
MLQIYSVKHLVGIYILFESFRFQASLTTENTMNENISLPSPMNLATELTVAWLTNPNTRTSADDVPSFLKNVFETITAIFDSNQGLLAAEAGIKEYPPAVTARKSLASSDVIISMIDGKPYKALRRHLSANGLTPTEYRERYGLKADYPMVALDYSESRRALANKIGLGRHRAQTTGVEAPAKPAAPRKRKTLELAAE